MTERGKDRGREGKRGRGGEGERRRRREGGKDRDIFRYDRFGVRWVK